MPKVIEVDSTKEFANTFFNDVVPVVRCKDCKHWLHDFPGCTDAIGLCEWANYMVGCNGYCVYGERRTNAQSS